jgi:predicted  nucleic acid-binding Zn-ribbon protein
MAGIFRRRHAPPRQPHPDPRMEARLQRIVALRESAARKGDLSRQYAGEIGKLSKGYRNRAFNGYPASAGDLERRLNALQGELRQVEAEIGRIHDEIAARTAELSDTDLAYL